MFELVAGCLLVVVCLAAGVLVEGFVNHGQSIGSENGSTRES